MSPTDSHTHAETLAAVTQFDVVPKHGHQQHQVELRTPSPSKRVALLREPPSHALS